jgi:hypothetical protein
MGYKPNISYLRVWGCLVFVYIPKEKRKRFDAAGEPGIFLGFNGTKHAIVYNLVRQNVSEHRHLRFHENRYPGLVRSKDRVGQLQDEYFKHPFNDNDAFFETYDPRDVMDENNSDSESSSYEDETDIDGITFEPNDMYQPEIDNFPDDLPEGLIDGNDTDADEEERVYDDALDMFDYEGEPLEYDVFSESIEIEPDKDDELMYDSLDGEDDSANDEVHPDDWEEPKIAMEDDHDEESSRRWYDELSEMNQHRPIQQTLDELFTVQEYLQNNLFKSKSRREARQANRGLTLNVVRGTRNEQIRSRHSKAKYELSKLIQCYSVMMMTMLYVRTMVLSPEYYTRQWKHALNATPSIYPEKPIKVADLPPLPKTMEEATAPDRPDRDKWIAARDVEIQSYYDREIWEPLWINQKDKSYNLISSKWVFDYKQDSEGYLLRYKVRGVARGFTQKEGIDYNETFSPVVKIQSVRLMLAVALMYNLEIDCMDVSTAFLYGELDELVYMKPFPGMAETNAEGKILIFRLKKSLYGLHQASRQWNKTLADFLIDEGFTKCQTDPCVFWRINQSTKEMEMVLVYVDDLIIMSNKKELTAAMKERFKSKFKMTDQGPAEWILGLKVRRVENGIFVNQAQYAMDMLIEAGMWDMEVKGHRIPVTTKSTPMSSTWTHDPLSPRLYGDDITKYKSFLMKLSYLAQQTRPDIAYAVNTLAQFQIEPRECHWRAIIHLLRYVRGTHDLGMFYHRNSDPMALFTNDQNLLEREDAPIGYADASYAEENDRKSRSAFVFMFCGVAILWYSKKQSVVALSSTEAEYYALGECVKEALWLRNILQELSISMNGPTIIMEDNQSTIAIANNPIHHQRVKHLDVKSHFLRDHIEKGDVELVYCPTEDQIADLLTKPLSASQHWKLVSLMGMRSESDLDGTSPFSIMKENYSFKWNIQKSS